MNKKFIYGALGVIAAVEYRRYTSFIDTVSINAKNLKLTKDGKNIKATFQLVIVNSSTKSIKVKSLSGSISSGTFKIGDFKINQSSTIEANQTNIIPCTALIDMQRISNQLEKFSLTSKIRLTTNTLVNFDIVSLLSIPVGIKNVTMFDGSALISELKSIIKNFAELFLKK
jgi:LEA14-like dessication related protein